MAYNVQQRELWGGAVVVDLPNDLLDASNVRPVPDNQECFTSPTPYPINASLIFEIMEYVKPGTTNSAVLQDPAIDSVQAALLQERADQEAINYHMYDLIQLPHRHQQLGPATYHTLSSPGMAQFVAYGAEAVITEPFQDSTESLSTATQYLNLTDGICRQPTFNGILVSYLFFLIVRMPDQETDLLAQLNIQTSQMTPMQHQAASSIMTTIANTLEIKDMGLFGTPDQEEAGMDIEGPAAGGNQMATTYMVQGVADSDRDIDIDGQVAGSNEFVSEVIDRNA